MHIMIIQPHPNTPIALTHAAKHNGITNSTRYRSSKIKKTIKFLQTKVSGNKHRKV